MHDDYWNGIVVDGTAQVDSSGAFTVTSTALQFGDYEFHTRVLDEAGNISLQSPPLPVTIDIHNNEWTAAPLLAGESNSGSRHDTITYVNYPLFYVGNAGQDQRVRIYSDGALISSEYAMEILPGRYGYATPISDGVHLITYDLTDVAGNSSPMSAATSVTIDTPPLLPNLSPASDSGVFDDDNVTNISVITFIGTGVAGDTVTLYEGDTVIGSAPLSAANSYSITSPPLSEGIHEIFARFSWSGGPGGMLAVSPTLTVVVDQTPPAPLNTPDLEAESDSGSSSIDNITSDNTPIFSGVGISGEYVEILNGTTRVGIGPVTNGSYSIETDELLHGMYSISARSMDVAGNVSAVSPALSVMIDTMPPAPPVAPNLVEASDSGSSDSDNLTNLTILTFTGTGTDGDLATLYADGLAVGTAVVTDDSYTVTSDSLNAGTLAITVAFTDLAGNVSVTSPALSVTIDTTPPASPLVPDLVEASDSGSSNSDDLTNLTTPTFLIAGASHGDLAILEIRKVGTVSWTTSSPVVVPVSGVVSVQANSLTEDGAYEVRAILQDPAWSAGEPSAILTFTLDTTPPTPPVFDAISTDDRISGIEKSAGVTVSGSAPPNSAVTVVVSQGGTVFSPPAIVSDSSGLWTLALSSATLSSFTDGTLSLTASVQDEAGNAGVGTASVVLDTTAPGGLTINGPIMGDGFVNASEVVGVLISGAGAESTNSNVTVVLTGTIGQFTANATVANDGTWVLSISEAVILGLGEGAISVVVQEVDVAGNPGQSVSTSFTLDTTPPTTAPSNLDLLDADDSGELTTDNITNLSQPRFTWSGGVQNDWAQLFLQKVDINGVAVGQPILGRIEITDIGGTFSVIPAMPLADGRYEVHAAFADAAGNLTTDVLAPFYVVIDTQSLTGNVDLAPSSDTGSASDDDLTDDTTPTFTGVVEPLSIVRLYRQLGGVELTSATGPVQADSAGMYSFTVANVDALADGVHQITVNYTDQAGNTSQQSASLDITIDTVSPVIATTQLMVLENDAAWTGTLTTIPIEPASVPLSWSIVSQPLDGLGQPIDLFEVDSLTGVVSVKTLALLNYESLTQQGHNPFVITVQAHDGVQSSSQQISVDIVDVNEQHTILNNQVFTVLENRTAPEPLRDASNNSIVLVNDEDSNPLLSTYHTYTYSLLSGPSFVAIDATSGSLRVVGTVPDYEYTRSAVTGRSLFTARVLATDSANPQLSYQRDVTVEILDDTTESAEISVGYSTLQSVTVDLVSNVTEVDFAPTVVIGSSREFEFTVRNSGNVPLTLTAPVVLGQNSGFTISQILSSTTVAGGGTSTFRVKFQPTAAGPVSTTIELGNSEGNGLGNEIPFFIKVKADAVATAGKLQVLSGGATLASGAFLDFGTSNSGQSIQRTLTLKNVGTAGLEFASTSPLTLPNGFSVSPSLSGLVLPIGQSQDIVVVFNPNASGVISGPMTFNTMNPTASLTVTLSGERLSTTSGAQDRILYVDNGDAGFTTNFSVSSPGNDIKGGGFGLNAADQDVYRVLQSATTGGQSQFAQWQTTALVAGLYRISVTWAMPDSDQLTGKYLAVAPYTVSRISSATTSALDTLFMQQSVAPDDMWESVYGHRVSWEHLGVFSVGAGDSLSVRLNVPLGLDKNAALIDAARFELLSPKMDSAFISLNSTDTTINVLANDGFPAGDWHPEIVNLPSSGTATVNVDGSITYHSDVPGEETSFTYRLANSSGAVTSSTTVRVNRAVSSEFYRDDSLTTSYLHPVTFDVSANDGLRTQSPSLTFGGVRNGVLQAPATNGNQWKVLDNGFYVAKDSVGSWTLSLRVNGSNIVQNYTGTTTQIRDAINAASQTASSPLFGVVARIKDLNRPGVTSDYLELHVADPSLVTPSIELNGVHANAVQGERGEIRVDSGNVGVATFTPNATYYRDLAGPKYDPGTLPGGQVGWFGEYTEELSYRFTSDTNVATFEGQLFIRITNSAPTFELPERALMTHDGGSGFTYGRLTFDSSDSDGMTADTTVVRLKTGLSGDRYSYLGASATDQQLEFRSQNSNSDDQLNNSVSFSLVATDGIVFSPLRMLTVGSVKYDAQTFPNPPIPSSNNLFRYDDPIMTTSGPRSANSPNYTLTAQLQHSGLSENDVESLGGVGVNLQTGASQLVQSLSTSSSGNNPFALVYSSDTASAHPIIEGTIHRSSVSIVDETFRVRLRWLKIQIENVNATSVTDNIARQPGEWQASAEMTYIIPAGSGDYHFAISGPEFSQKELGSGQYRWQLEVQKISATGVPSDDMRAYGDAIIIKNGRDDRTPNPFSGFGSGWSLAGLPRLMLEKNFESTTSTPYAPWRDDRAIMSWGGSDARLFEPYWKQLAAQGNPNDNVEAGWRAIDPTTHIVVRQELGQLTRATVSGGVQWTYVSEDGTKYVFNEVSHSTNFGTVAEPNVVTRWAALLQSIQPVVGPTITFTYTTTHQIDTITSEDGTVTEFVYGTSSLLQEIQTKISGNVVRRLVTDVVTPGATNGDAFLKSLVLQDGNGSPVWTRRFGFTKQVDIQIFDLPPGTGTTTYTIGGKSVQLSHAILQDDALLESTLRAALADSSGFSSVSGSLLNKNQERHTVSNYNFSTERVFRIVFNGSDWLDQDVGVSGPNIAIQSTSYLLSMDSWGVGTTPATADRVSTMTYDGRGQVTQVTTGSQSGHQTTYSVQTSASQLWRTAIATYPLPTITTTTTTATIGTNQAFTLVDKKLRVAYTLDRLGRLVKRDEFYDTIGDAPSTTPVTSESWERDAFGNVIRETDSLGRVTSFRYDSTDAGRHLHQGDVSPFFDTQSTFGTATINDSSFLKIQPNHHGRLVESFFNVTLMQTAYESHFGLPTHTTNALGRTTTFAYPQNANGQVTAPLVTQIAGPGGALEKLEYYSGVNADLVKLRHVLVRKDQSGEKYLTTHYEFDAQRRVSKTTMGVWNFTTNAFVTDLVNAPNDAPRIKHFTYDSLGNLDMVSDLLPALSRIDQQGNYTDTDYDAAGRLLHEAAYWDIDGATTTFSPLVIASESYTYFSDGLVNTHTDGNGNLTTYQYDQRGLLTSMIAGDNDNAIEQETEYLYYEDSSLQQVTHPDGSHTSYFYDFGQVEPAMGEVRHFKTWTRTDGVYTTAAAATAGTVTYLTVEETADALGRTLFSKNYLTGAETAYGYDAYDRLTTTTLVGVNLGSSTGNITTQRQYDVVGNLIREQSPLMAARVYRYDSRDQLISSTVEIAAGETDARGGEMRYVYDAGGRLVQSIETRHTPNVNANGTIGSVSAQDFTTVLTPNIFGEIISSTMSIGGGDTATTSAAAYNNLGQMTSSTDRFGNVTNYVYDALGRVRQVDTPNHLRVTTDYDLAGNMTSVQLDDWDMSGPVANPDLGPVTTAASVHRRTEYLYDALNRQNETRYILPERNATGLLQTTTTASGVVPNYLTGAANPLNETTSWVLGNGQTTITMTDRGGGETEIVRDAIGNTISVTQPDPDFTVGTQSSPVTRYEYVYNANDKSLETRTTDPSLRTSRTIVDGLVTEIYSNAADSDYSLSQVSDQLGRMAYERDGDDNGTVYSYDPVTGLVSTTAGQSVLKGQAKPSVFHYDSAGNRVMVTDAEGHQTKSSYDGLNRPLTEEIMAEYAAAGPTRSITYQGLTTTLTNRNGEIIRTTLDPIANESVERWFATGTTDFTGNPIRQFQTKANSVGQLMSVVDPVATVWVSYDDLGRQDYEQLVSTVDGYTIPTVGVASQYNNLFVRDQLEVSLGPDLLSRTTYGVDALGRTTSISQDLASTNDELWHNGSVGSDKFIGIDYFADSRIEQVTRRMTDSTGDIQGISEYHYDYAGRLIGLRHFQDSALDRIATHLASYTPDGKLFARLTQFFNTSDGQLAPSSQNPELVVPGKLDANGNLVPGYAFGGQVESMTAWEVRPSALDPRIDSATIIQADWQNPTVISSNNLDNAGNSQTKGQPGDANRVQDGSGYFNAFDQEGQIVERVAFDARFNGPNGPHTNVTATNFPPSMWESTGGAYKSLQGAGVDVFATVSVGTVGPGRHTVWATWNPELDLSVAEYRILNGSNVLSGVVSVDQSLQPSGGVAILANGRYWKAIGTVDLTANTDLMIEIKHAPSPNQPIVVEQLLVLPEFPREVLAYDHRNRLTSVSTIAAQPASGAPPSPVEVISYTYDGLNRLIGRVESNTSGTITTTDRVGYFYDGASRLGELALSTSTTTSAGTTTVDHGGTVQRLDLLDAQGMILAIDDALAPSANTVTVWAFSDLKGNLSSFRTETLNGTAIRHVRFDEDGNVTFSPAPIGAGTNEIAALNRAPLVWKGLFRDADTGLVELGGGSQYDPRTGRSMSDRGGLNGYVPFGNNTSENYSEINWSKLEGPGAFGDIGAFGFGVWDSIAFGHFDDLIGADGAQAEAMQNGWYWAGMGVGVAGQMALGNWAAGATLANASRTAYVGVRAYQAYSIAGDVVGVYDSVQSYRNGTFGAMDLLGFAPSVGWAMGAARGVRGLRTRGLGVVDDLPGPVCFTAGHLILVDTSLSERFLASVPFGESEGDAVAVAFESWSALDWAQGLALVAIGLAACQIALPPDNSDGARRRRRRQNNSSPLDSFPEWGVV